VALACQCRDHAITLIWPLPFCHCIALISCACSDKVVKPECDRIGQGLVSSTRLRGPPVSQPVDAASKPLVLGRVEVTAAPPHVHGRQPKLGHIPRVLIPPHFYV
jgi:hypothetical protein